MLQRFPMQSPASSVTRAIGTRLLFPRNGPRKRRSWDGFVRRLVDQNLVVAKYQPVAIREFRLAAMTSAVTARSVYSTEKDRNRALGSIKPSHNVLKSVERTLNRLPPLDTKGVPPNDLGDVLAAQADLKSANDHLAKARHHLQRIAKLPVRDTRRTDIFRTKFVENLFFCWDRLTKKATSKSGFVRFVRVSFLIVGLNDDGADIGRYIRDVFKRREIS